MTGSKQRILIIDDEEDICTIFKDIITEYSGLTDYDVSYVTTAPEAFERLKQSVYDLLFVDIKLQGSTSGIDIIKECRNMRPMPKIIILSAIPQKVMEPTFKEEAIDNLIEQYLEKKDDLVPAVVSKVITRVLGKNDKIE